MGEIRGTCPRDMCRFDSGAVPTSALLLTGLRMPVHLRNLKPRMRPQQTPARGRCLSKSGVTGVNRAKALGSMMLAVSELALSHVTITEDVCLQS